MVKYRFENRCPMDTSARALLRRATTSLGRSEILTRKRPSSFARSFLRAHFKTTTSDLPLNCFIVQKTKSSAFARPSSF